MLIDKRTGGRWSDARPRGEKGETRTIAARGSKRGRFRRREENSRGAGRVKVSGGERIESEGKVNRKRRKGKEETKEA